jgi:hypothetical protein
MQKLPQSGTASAVHATFRLILNDSSENFSTIQDAVGKSVMLEPFDFPGMVLVDQGKEEDLGIADSPSGVGSSAFRMVAGLDGNAETVSLESESNKDCFVYNSGESIKLSCKLDSASEDFSQAASFVLNKGISEYHPMSFVATGVKRNFLLAPLLSFRDEYYTVYFNFHD